MQSQGEDKLVELFLLASILPADERPAIMRDIVRLAVSSGRIEAMSEFEKRIDETFTGLVK